ncbi:hypothetical protein F938_01201 [Acinetobacter bereziniae LMG 1003 = CIP 70.12]|uniref:Uncharacterized protein n=1 Tax=Acinetobacter bereziniae LMG 1003 = CIP 70.12 TaxID=981324 RepID=N9DIV1_ACIBZ|nr:hypothetical protein [Acinetobacter bereziniae]ENV98142.1 hypothetical protein F938_01201 [Acinetobacter bereziniae LMG 1003 = CIP 70.12]
MAMKQTQTKMFDFSDVGLDFCVGSKNLFPDRFKKILTQGYNTQTVSSVVVTGNQVALTYGVNHGYVANRVLKLNAVNLTGEYVIDSVTNNTITLTVDNAPATISGGFTTYIAPLGWQLVYEQANIQVYKLKSMDESDLYLRLCFQNNSNYRNRISPCVGKSFDSTTGKITDSYSLAESREISTPNTFAWEFSRNASSTANDYTYTQGYPFFGKGNIVGSKYHLVMFTWSQIGEYGIRTNALLPFFNIGYESLNYPVLIGDAYGSIDTTGSNDGQIVAATGAAYVGNYRVLFQEQSDGLDTTLAKYNNSASSFLPDSIDTFNTTTANLPLVYLRANGQFIGNITGGLYFCRYASSNNPAFSPTTLPTTQKDVEQKSELVLHGFCAASNGQRLYVVSPIEEIKLGY